MTNHVQSPERGLTARRSAVAGLTTAAAAIILQILGGADYPPVPPGAILLVVAAVLFAVRTRWTPVAGILIPLFLSVGAVATPDVRDHLSEPSQGVVFAGTLIQLLGMAVGLVCGAAVVVGSIREGRRG